MGEKTEDTLEYRNLLGMYRVLCGQVESQRTDLVAVTAERDALKAENADLRRWAKLACDVIGQAGELMPLHHMSQWEGYLGVLELAPGADAREVGP